MTQSKSIWDKQQLAREQARAIFIIGVTGIFGMIRFADIGKSLSKSFYLFTPIDVIDILIAHWIGYLIVMVFAVSEDIFGCRIANAARTLGYLFLVFGLFVAVVAVGVMTWSRDPYSTVLIVTLVAVFLLYRRSSAFRKLVRTRFGPT
jgi:hypothetical protein